MSSKNNKDTRVDGTIRSIFKKDVSEGGLNITDAEFLNKLLKLRKCVRANRSKYPIKIIQRYCVKQMCLYNRNMINN